MKIKLLLFVLSISCISLTSEAQNATKIGYADIDYILAKMPESSQVNTTLQAFNNQLQKELQAEVNTYQAKLSEYQQKVASMETALRQSTEQELTNLQQKIQRMESTAQQSIQKKRSDLLNPLYEKIGTNLNAFAKEQGFTHILNSQINGVSLVLYGEKRFDVSDAILARIKGNSLQKN